MEAYSACSFEDTERVIDTWSDALLERLEGSPTFRLMPDQRKTNPSIISMQVWVNGRPLEHDELKVLFEAICLAEHDGFSGSIRRVFIGQPVIYGAKSFIRLAIGSYTIRHFLDTGGVNLQNDYRLIEILEEYAERLFGQ